MSEMFYGCTSFTKELIRQIDAHDRRHEWDVSKVTNMSGMFRNCRIMDDIFSHNYSWTQSIENWDVSKVTDMSYMFSDCVDAYYDKNDLDEPNGDVYENYCIPVGVWNVSNVKNMSYMFYNCKGLILDDVLDWNVMNVEDTSYMFYNCKKFNSNMRNWQLVKLKHWDDMIEGCTSLYEMYEPDVYSGSALSMHPDDALPNLHQPAGGKRSKRKRSKRKSKRKRSKRR